MEPQEIKRIIESLLFVSDQPLGLNTLQQILESMDRRTLLACLDELKAEYDMQSRAFQLVEIAEGYQLVTRNQYAPWIRRLYKSPSANKLSRAALETLAIIAYRQPVTRAEIEDIRGVSVDAVVNALLERKFIRIVGRKEVVGRPWLYGTTKEFLHYFGLKDLNDMPELKDLQEMLKSDEAGKSWDLNPQGELVAKANSESGEDSAQPKVAETLEDSTLLPEVMGRAENSGPLKPDQFSLPGENPFAKEEEPDDLELAKEEMALLEGSDATDEENDDGNGSRLEDNSAVAIIEEQTTEDEYVQLEEDMDLDLGAEDIISDSSTSGSGSEQEPKNNKPQPPPVDDEGREEAE